MSEACMKSSLAAGTSSTTSCRQKYHVTLDVDHTVTEKALKPARRRYLRHSDCLGTLPREEKGSVRLEVGELCLCRHLHGLCNCQETSYGHKTARAHEVRLNLATVSQGLVSMPAL